MKINQKQQTPVAYKFGLGCCIYMYRHTGTTSSHRSCDNKIFHFRVFRNYPAQIITCDCLPNLNMGLVSKLSEMRTTDGQNDGRVVWADMVVNYRFLWSSSSHQSWRKKWEAAPVTPFATALAVIIHWQTELVIIQRQKFINTADKLSLCLYNGKRLSTLRTNWVCDYTTAKVYQHWQTEIVII